MIQSYKIVSADNETTIEVEVAALLKRGWQPQGGIAFIPETTESKMWYAQAMTLDDGA